MAKKKNKGTGSSYDISNDHINEIVDVNELYYPYEKPSSKNKKKSKQRFEIPEKKIITDDDGNEYAIYGNETIINENAAYAAEKMYKNFSANKNLYRMIPSMIDGFKPGKRRFYYAWWIKDGAPNSVDSETFKKRKLRKLQVLAGFCMEIHPHSDSGVLSAAGKDGQSFLNNVMLLQPSGSYGNIKGDDPGAPRYLDARFSEFTMDCFFEDFQYYCVPMKPSYNEATMEPESFLPAKYPVILFNPQMSSIGNALASNIPSFNVKEVLEATIKLIKDPKSKVMLIPDIPTKADVVDNGEFVKINETGEGTMMLQASAEIDYNNNIIRFTSIPLQVNTNTIISKIVDLKKSKTLDDIIDVQDFTTGGDVDLELKVRPGVNPDKILDKLYKRTPLRNSYPVSITVIDDFKDYTWGIKKLLLEWIEYRRDIVTAMLLNKHQIFLEKQHMNDILIEIFHKDNLDKAVEIAKTSKSRKESEERFMKTFKISSVQASVIADMKVYQFNKDQREKFIERAKELKKEVEQIEYFLDSDKHIDEFIISQLEDGIKKYGKPRVSKVVKIDNIDEEDIPDIDYLIGITRSGLIKKIPVSKYSSIGPFEQGSGSLTVLKINNREDILIATSTGNIIRIPISSVVETEFNNPGIPMGPLFGVTGTVEAVMELPNVEVLKDKNNEYSLMIITKQGFSKRTPISEFKKITNPRSIISLDKGDEVVHASFVNNKKTKEIIIFTNKGNGIRIKADNIKEYGKAAKGLGTILLTSDEFVTGAGIADPKKEFVFYITSNGNMKLTESEFFPVMERRDAPISLIKLSQREELIGVSTVSKKDKIILYKKLSEPTTIDVKDIPVKARLSSGEKVFKLGKGDAIVSYKIFS